MGARAVPGGHLRPPWRTRSQSTVESLPSPRGAHLEMVGAVLAGDGLERVAEIAARLRGAKVAVDRAAPRRAGGRSGRPTSATWPRGWRAAAHPPDRDRRRGADRLRRRRKLGAVLMLGRGTRRRRRVPARGGGRRADRGGGRRGARRDRAVAARLVPRGAAARATTWTPATSMRRARRLGCDLSDGAVGARAPTRGERAPGPADRRDRGRARRARCAQTVGGEGATRCCRVASRRRGASPPGWAGTRWSGISSRYTDAGRPAPRAGGGRARARGHSRAAARPRRRRSAAAPTACSSGCWRRTPRRCGRSSRTRSRRSCATTSSTRPTCSGR